MGIENACSQECGLALFPNSFFIEDKTLNPISGLRHYYDDIYELSALRDPRVNLNFLFFSSFFLLRDYYDYIRPFPVDMACSMFPNWAICVEIYSHGV